MKKSIRGFTIVELLIVIVVIAILAAISIVAYNGIQTRAENTKTLQAVQQYVKLIQAYSALEGGYPVDSAYPCLGPAGTTCARVSGSVTCAASADGMASATSNFETLLKEVSDGPLPSLSKQVMSGCSTNSYSGGYYRGTTGASAVINYYLRGNVDCSVNAGTVSKTQSDDMTRCATIFPAQ